LWHEMIGPTRKSWSQNENGLIEMCGKKGKWRKIKVDRM
jgi:hypothetical protein